MATNILLREISAILDPDAPETLVHVTASVNVASTGDPTAYTYDYNSATEDFPTLCEAANANGFEYDDGCGA